MALSKSQSSQQPIVFICRAWYAHDAYTTSIGGHTTSIASSLGLRQPRCVGSKVVYREGLHPILKICLGLCAQGHIL